MLGNCTCPRVCHTRKPAVFIYWFCDENGGHGPGLGESRTFAKTARTSSKGTNAVLISAYVRATRRRRSEDGNTTTGLWAMESLSRCKVR